MTSLQKNALGKSVMPIEEVEKIHAVCDGYIDQLCYSHERLRAEVEGANVLIEDFQKVDDAAVKAMAGIPNPAEFMARFDAMIEKYRLLSRPTGLEQELEGLRTARGTGK